MSGWHRTTNYVNSVIRYRIYSHVTGLALQLQLYFTLFFIQNNPKLYYSYLKLRIIENWNVPEYI